METTRGRVSAKQNIEMMGIARQGVNANSFNAHDHRPPATLTFFLCFNEV